MRASHEGKFLASTKRDPCFISKGFVYWKEANTAFRKHEGSQCHREATQALVLLPQQVRDIGEVLSNEHRQEKAMNRKMFMMILQTLSFLARQGLAIRGHGDENSNFHQLLLLRSTDCQDIIDWLKKKSNKYTSHEVQNECLRVMPLQITRQLSKDIGNSQCYTIMADECTDISNQEQFTICLRWVDNDLIDHEDFIGLYKVSNIGAGTLADAIKDTLIRMNLDISRCRGQCYDGASNMSGGRSGVASRLMVEEKRAVYTHCYGHALNLAVGSTMKQSDICRAALEVAFEITKLIKFSPKRNAIFDRIKADCDDSDGGGVGIRSFCPTRWTVRGASVSSILANYNILTQLWDECLEGSLVPDVKGRIVGVKFLMSQFKLLFGLRVCERVLNITDNLSRTLQTESLSAAEAQVIAGKTVETLRRMRTDEMFDIFWQSVESLRASTNTEKAKLPRKRQSFHVKGKHLKDMKLEMEKGIKQML